MIDLKDICARNPSIFDPSYISLDDITQMHIDLKMLVRAIENGELVPVVHGRWNITEYDSFCCSACGKTYYNGAESTEQAQSDLDSGNTHKFCHNCGARMDAEDEKR